MSTTRTAERGPEPFDWQVLRGLFWYDWKRHGFGLVVGLSSVAVAMFAIGLSEPLHDRMMLYMGLGMAVGCGLGMGRGELSVGEEEYTLALPPVRRDRWLSRFAFGLLAMLGIYLIGVLTCLTDLPGWLAGLVGVPVDSIRQQEMGEYALGGGPTMIALAWAGPLALYVETFAVSTSVMHRSDVRWLPGSLAFLIGTIGLVELDRFLLGASGGWLLASGLLAYAGLRARLGLKAYERKEAVLDALPPGDPGAREAVKIALVLGLGLAVLGGLVMWYMSAKGGGE